MEDMEKNRLFLFEGHDEMRIFAGLWKNVEPARLHVLHG